MTKQDTPPRFDVLRELEDSLQSHRNTCRPDMKRSRARMRAAWWRIRGGFRRPLVRRLTFGVGAAVAVALLACAGIWLRLAAGPIQIDMASPWLSSAIEANIGGRHGVEIGGTQIERDEHGRAAVRIRDIVIRDGDGAIVANAAKAEVSVSGSGLLRGQVRARRVSLVGVELAVRIEDDGQVTISTGGERRPLAVTPAIVKPGSALPGAAPTPVPEPAVAAAAAADGAERFIALVGWLDRVSALGLDGEGLGEIGLKQGILNVDDLRTGKHWTFEQINFSVNRPGGGGISVSLGSENEERPWSLTAAVTPNGFQRRVVQIDLKKVSTKDLFLATRLDEGQFQSDLPITGSLRAEIGADSLPKIIEGRLAADGGLIGNPNDVDGAFRIDRAEFNIDWDANRRSLVVPFQILSGANRVTLISRFEAPTTTGAPWRILVTGGAIVLSEGNDDPQPLILNRVMLRGNLDFAKRRIELEQGDIAGTGVSGYLNGSLDFSGSEPRLLAGLALTPMSSVSAKKVWPVFVASKVRNWVAENLQSGDIERVDVAANAPIDTLKEGGPPIPHDGLSVDVMVRNAVIRPSPGLPPISEADLKTSIRGRQVVVNVGRGIVDMGNGRRLTVSNGVFEVPDTDPKAPPARVRFRVDGPVQAAAELLSLEKLRDESAMPLDPATSRGNFSGQVMLGMNITKDPPPGSTQYAVNVDINGFAADKMVMGQKLEAQVLKVAANNQGVQIKGDVRINGTPAALDYRKATGNAEAEIRVLATLDEAARARFGFETGAALSGPVPVKLSGRLGNEKDKDVRLTVEADLTPAKIENLMPGWVKPPGKPTKATFTLVNRDKTTRLEDLVIDGAGVNVKGQIEMDSSGDLVSANLPVFALSDGDKTSLKVDRTSDGVLRVVMRGEVYDGRNFVKSSLGSEPGEKPKKNPADLDLDIKLGAVAGHNGEALRGVDLKMARRNGQIRSFALNSKIGRDTVFSGNLRAAQQGRNVMYFETVDAGALFRFTDFYPRMVGGQMWIAMDPPTSDQAPQEGIVNVRDFVIRGEPALNRVVGAAQNGTKGVDFTRMKVDFTRQPGKLNVKEGVVRGPTVGATVEGNVDFAKNDVKMRGTFVPLYGLNNALGQIPIVGLFLGGANEGLVGITYEVVGPPSAPTLRVNPISAVAPGLLRKFFEFPGAAPQNPQDDLPTNSSTR